MLTQRSLAGELPALPPLPKGYSAHGVRQVFPLPATLAPKPWVTCQPACVRSDISYLAHPRVRDWTLFYTRG